MHEKYQVFPHRSDWFSYKSRGGKFNMAFQVMGVTAGRKNSNSEILLKEALLVCQEMGAEVRMINLKDYNIIDCNGCT